VSAETLRRCLGLACGPLGWTPAAFWAATPQELAAAVEALNRARGRVPPAEKRRAFAAFRDAVEEGLQARARGRAPARSPTDHPNDTADGWSGGEAGWGRHLKRDPE
jgi:hypothetical protein